MLDVQAALESTGVPGYRGAFRPTEEIPDTPDCYCEYTLSRTPIWPQDDQNQGTRIRAFLHLFSTSDPEWAQVLIRTAMLGEGFSLLREEEGYVPEAEDYEVFSEWEGLSMVPIDRGLR